jgi:ribosomal protein L7/L12
MTFFQLALLAAIAAIVVGSISVLLNGQPLPGIKSDADVLDILKRGDRLKAIKAYRQLHRASLKQARAFVDDHSALQGQIGAQGR